MGVRTIFTFLESFLLFVQNYPAKSEIKISIESAGSCVLFQISS